MHNSDVEELYDIVPYKTRFMSTVGHTKSRQSSGSFVTGDRKSHVLEVQLRLKAKGYYEGAIDGIYGEGRNRPSLI